MTGNLLTSITSLSGRTKFVAGLAAAVLVATVLIYTSSVTILCPSGKAPEPAHGPVKTAGEAIALAEKCMRTSGYAGEPAKDYWPRGNELVVLLAGKGNILEMRRSRALWYEPKAAAYEELEDRWIVGFPNRGGGDYGVQVIVYKDGRAFILHDPPSCMSYFKCRIEQEPKQVVAPNKH